MVGTAVRLYLIRILGEAFEKPIEAVLDFIREYRLPLTALSLTLVVVTVVLDRRSGKGELEAILDIEDELGVEEDPVSGPPDGPVATDRSPTVEIPDLEDDPRRALRVSRGTAVVTGASSGIGAATAVALAEAGFDVVVGARRLDQLRAVAEPIGARALPLDVTDDESVAAFVAEVPECSVLVNNAGGAFGLEPDRGGRPRRTGRRCTTPTCWARCG